MKVFATALLFIFLTTTALAQIQLSGGLHFNKFPPLNFLLDKGWKFQAGDNPEWARSDFDDSSWKQVSLSDFASYLPEFQKKHIGWFRIKIFIDSPGTTNAAVIAISQLGASDCFINGSPFLHLGRIGPNGMVKSDNPHSKPFLFHTNLIDTVTLAIRFASAGPDRPWLLRNTKTLPLSVSISDWSNALNRYEADLQFQRIPLGLSFLSVGIGILFLLIYIFSPEEKINLLFIAFCFSLAMMAGLQYQLSEGNLDLNSEAIAFFLSQLIDRICSVLVLCILSLIVFNRLNLYQWAIIFYFLGLNGLFIYFSPPGAFINTALFLGRLLFAAELVRISFYGFLHGRFIVGFLSLASGVLHFTYILLFLIHRDHTVYYIRFNQMLCFAVLSMYLISKFAMSSKVQVPATVQKKTGDKK
jgi:two-component system, NtrC family, sensor kinase